MSTEAWIGILLSISSLVLTLLVSAVAVPIGRVLYSWLRELRRDVDELKTEVRLAKAERELFDRWAQAELEASKRKDSK